MFAQTADLAADDELYTDERQRDLQESDLWLLDSLSAGPLSFGGDDPALDEPLPSDVNAARIHALALDPPIDDAHSTIWRYTPADARRLYQNVQYVAAGSSFIGRILLAITRGGDSKNFEELTGQDGLTFGITDFAGNQGCRDFFQKFYED
jgi:hypothetical protein